MPNCRAFITAYLLLLLKYATPTGTPQAELETCPCAENGGLKPRLHLGLPE